mmetsp:Transcript_36066/g.60777  ORF Transcript_36066/g.60777 Transcript_36066/m.60777 type:complete len:204 (+) Transcript_36066:1434-2045(+)
MLSTSTVSVSLRHASMGMQRSTPPVSGSTMAPMEIGLGITWSSSLQITLAGSHSSHVSCRTVAQLPRLHLQSLRSLEPAIEIISESAHGMHMAWPSSSWYVFAGHTVHTVAPPNEKVPGWHSAHSLWSSPVGWLNDPGGQGEHEGSLSTHMLPMHVETTCTKYPGMHLTSIVTSYSAEIPPCISMVTHLMESRGIPLRCESGK